MSWPDYVQTFFFSFICLGFALPTLRNYSVQQNVDLIVIVNEFKIYVMHIQLTPVLLRHTQKSRTSI